MVNCLVDIHRTLRPSTPGYALYPRPVILGVDTPLSVFEILKVAVTGYLIFTTLTNKESGGTERPGTPPQVAGQVACAYVVTV